MKRSVVIGTLALLAALWVGCTPSEPTSTPVPTPKLVAIPTRTRTPTPTATPVPTPTPVPLTEVYTNDALGFSIAYPFDWEITTETDLGIQVVTIAHVLGSNVTIAVEPISGLTLEEYVAVSLEGFTESLPGFLEASRTRTNVPPGYLIEGDAPIDGTTGLVKLLISVDGDYGLVAASFVRGSLSGLHQPTLDRMLDSLRTFPAQGLPPDGLGDMTLPRELLEEIAANVVQLRELEPLRDVDRTFMTRAELGAFLLGELEEDRQDIFHTQELLATLDLIPEGLDLYQLILALYTEQVLGFYVPEVEELYVVSELERFGPNEEVTFAHEYVHALQQQYFDIYTLGKRVENDSDASAALSALIEGDAYLMTFEYMDGFLSLREQQEVFESGGDSPVLEGAPYAVQKLFLFDVEGGIPFILALVEMGQLDAINLAFSDPPVSTEQVFHPGKYLSGERPVAISLPDIAGNLGSGWAQADSDVLGKFFLRTYLETAVGDSVAAEAAAGWGGDRYALLLGPQGARVFVAVVAWDTQGDAREFSDVALAPLAGIPGKAYVELRGDRVLFIVAPSDALVDTVRTSIPGF